MFGNRMSAHDRRLWARADTLDDLGRLMGLWLSGVIRSRPAYEPNSGPDDETDDIGTGLLANVNRAGFITDNSQPAGAGVDLDGDRWWQRAAVDGFTTSDRADELEWRAARAGLWVVRGTAPQWRAFRASAILVSTGNLRGAVDTSFGALISRRELAGTWSPPLGDDALDALQAATQLTIVDPEWDNTGLLWLVLSEWVESRVDRGDSA